MGIIDIQIPASIARRLKLPGSLVRQQKRVLKRLLKKAKNTEFGQAYNFDSVLLRKDMEKAFQQHVPVFDYDKIYDQWWHKTLEGVPDVCWPGKIKYFALSSGTSGSASKYIPITNDLLRGNRVVMIKQLLSLRSYENIPVKSIRKGWLMLSGSTELQEGPGYYAGDLSGITAQKVPFWFTPFYKPSKKIARTRDWNEKLDEIVDVAPDWDIGFIVGVPAWIQMCLEMIIDRYKLNNIHELWPNLAFYVHGGVSFDPYKKGFEKLLGKPIQYIETYLASEGFIAYQDRQSERGMRLCTGQHIFLEFVPFTGKNFDASGDLVDNPETLLIDEVEEGKDYAILLSTSAGAWRYLIGDTIRFTDRERAEIIITGRTKHFLSLVGEHLSVDNMNKAIQLTSQQLNISIREFTVAGIPHGSFFAHHWFIACDTPVDVEDLKCSIDNNLKQLNDDYAVERKSALKDVLVTVLPEKKFMDFMESRGKLGGQNKFPRVMKGQLLEDWMAFIK